jgi:hypothetical protein
MKEEDIELRVNLKILINQWEREAKELMSMKEDQIRFENYHIVIGNNARISQLLDCINEVKKLRP